MEFLYRPGWTDAKERIAAFWRGETINRPYLILTAPLREKRNIVTNLKPHEQLLDFDFRIKDGEETIKSTYYGGEAVPCVWPDFSPEYTSACIGGNLAVVERSADEQISGSICWAKNVIDDWERDLPKLGFDRNSVWLKRGLDFTDMAVREGLGKYLVEILDVDGGLDTAASLRGTQRLCMDMLDCPDNVAALLDIVREGNRLLMDKLYARVKPSQGGMINTFKVYAPGVTYNMRSDFSYMIDPGLFREVGLPYMIKESEVTDNIIFHTHTEDVAVNTGGRFKYLDVILDVPRIRAVEWSCADISLDLWEAGARRIIDRDKMVFAFASPAQIIDLTKRLGRSDSCRALYSVRAECVREAEDLLIQLERGRQFGA